VDARRPECEGAETEAKSGPRQRLSYQAVRGPPAGKKGGSPTRPPTQLAPDAIAAKVLQEPTITASAAAARQGELPNTWAKVLAASFSHRFVIPGGRCVGGGSRNFLGT
jgi:hypothetical protein